MSGVLAPQWLLQALTDAGAVASGARLFSFVAGGGSVPTPVYADKALTTPLSNPYEFNSAGRGSFWLDPAVTYRLRLETAAGVLLAERDGVEGSADSRYVKTVDLANDADPAKGAGLVGYEGRTVRERLGDTVSLRDYSGDAVGDNWTTALQNALTVAGVDGKVIIPGNGYEYEINANISLNGQVVEGVGWPVLRWTGTSQSVDFFTLNGGSVEDSQSGTETIGSILRGVNLQIGASGELRDFVRVNYGDHTKIEDCKLSAGLRPCRDGIHIEPVCTPGSPKTWYIENTKLENVRISRAGRDGIQIKIPAKGVYENECFVNLGTILQCEVRGTGKNSTHRNTTDGVCAIRFLNAADVATTTHKISDWTILGGEYQTSPYATGSSDAPTFGIRNQHIDNTKGGKTEYITVVNGTFEKIEAGSMYAGSVGIDFSDVIRGTLINPGVFGYTYTRSLENLYKGNPSIIGTGDGMAYDAMRFGNQFMRRGLWTPAVEGETTAGTWTPSFALGSYFRMGQLVFAQFQLQGTLVGASGNIRVKNLPYTLHNDPSGANVNAFSAGGHIEVMEGVTFPANFTFAVLRGVPDTKNLQFWRHGSAQNSARVQASEVTGTLKLYGSIIFEARRFEDEDGVTYPKILWNS